MMVSTKGRYALRVMVELAERQTEGYISLKEIAQEQKISEKYLEAIMKRLVTEGLVVGLRGKGGGYQLAQPPDKCTVGMILRATEGSVSPVACAGLSTDACPRQDQCATFPMWRELDELINHFFDGITLKKLAEQTQISGNGQKLG